MLQRLRSRRFWILLLVSLTAICLVMLLGMFVSADNAVRNVVSQSKEEMKGLGELPPEFALMLRKIYEPDLGKNSQMRCLFLQVSEQIRHRLRNGRSSFISVRCVNEPVMAYRILQTASPRFRSSAIFFRELQVDLLQKHLTNQELTEMFALHFHPGRSLQQASEDLLSQSLGQISPDEFLSLLVELELEGESTSSIHQDLVMDRRRAVLQKFKARLGTN